MTEPHRCKDCRYWYGAEDDEYGPCQIKQARGDRRFVTFGGHACDEPLALAEYGRLELRRLTAEGLALARPLLEREGWSVESRHLARLHSLGGAVGAFERERMVGFLTFIDTPPYRWVGNVAVDPSLRGRGLGAQLVAEALRDAPKAALYSVEKAVSLYEREGLVSQGEVVGLRASEARPEPADEARPGLPGDLAEVCALDAAVTGMDRSRLLAALWSSFPSRVLRRGGRVMAFGVAKAYGDVTELGPVVAESSADGWSVVDALVLATPGPHDLVVHAVSDEATRRGFVPTMTAIPMFKGGVPAWDLSRYLGVAGLEKG